MTPNYRCSTITAGADVNIVPMILKELEAEGYTTPRFYLDFIGFEMKKGTKFKLNGNPMTVPTNNYFISPYDSENDLMHIHSVSFDSGITGQDIYYIY